MANFLERHPAACAVALGALIVASHTMTFRDEVATEIRYVERPHAGCRMPDPLTEVRVLIERRDDMGGLSQECVIVPRNREESPAATMQRLLNRKKIGS